MIDIAAIPLLLWIPACILFVVLGHELTHYLAWLPVATSIEYDFRNAYIVAEYPDTAFARRWGIIAGISPVIVAVGLVLALWATGYDPNASMQHFIGAIAVALYGLSGGKSDFDALIDALSVAAAKITQKL